MSQKLTPDSAQKGFAVGRGLLAAAETLNFSMGESHSDPYSSSSQQLGGMGGLGGGDGQDHDSQLPRRVGSHLSNTMKLFASLGLSPTDLDVLAQVPEENISVETLPHLIMQLKNRKVESSRHLAGDLPSHSPDTSYRGGRDDWGDMQGGRLDRSSGQSQSRASQSDFGYGSMQDVSTRSYDMLDYGGGGGGSSSRERQYSELSTDHYRGLGMASSSTSDDLFMQRRMGTPSQGKIQDFLGVMPHMFPHVCSLCDFDVHSAMEWTQHTTGMRHTENRRVLLQLYPDWDPQMPSRRLSGSLSLDTKGRSDGLLGAAPSSGLRQRSGMNSNWGSDSGMGMASKMQSYSVPPKIRSRVVVVKYDRKPMLSALFALANPFGTIRENLVLKNKAFLELQTHEEALAMANFYQKKPAILHGKEVQIYLSKELLVIEKSDRPERDSRNIKGANSQVVFFSNLPRETEKKMELLTVSRRFGTVEKHLFLNDQAFVQMSNPEDAEMLVKYYTLHPLTISRRPIHLNICTKYKTLTVPPGKGGQGRQDRDEVSLKSSSRTVTKTSSRSQRSTSSKARESSTEKTEEPKPEDEEEDVLAEGSGDEGEGVVEAHDEEEEAFDEDLATEEANQTCEGEQAMNEPPGPEASAACEDSAIEPAENRTHEAESMEMPEEADLEQEVHSEKPAVSEVDQEDFTEELKSMDGQGDVEQGEADDENIPEHFGEQEGPGESDFPENMDEFVTLDELAEEEEAERHDSKSRAKTSSGGSRESGGLRVVNVVGFKRSYGYLDEILALAKPFGKVVRHLVLDVRPEAFLELSSEQEAKAMVRFYSGNVIPSVCGKTVKIYHSQTYPTIQSGRVIYIGHIPPFKTSDASLLKIAEPFGKIRRYFLNRSRNECFIEMDRGEDAEKFAEACKENPPKFQGKRLVVYVSRKYKQLKHGHRPPSSEPEEKRTLKRERSEEEVEAQISSPVKTNVKKEEEPPIKKAKEEKPTTDNAESASKEVEQEDKEAQDVSSESVPEVKKEDTEKLSGDTTEVHNTENKPKAENDDSATPPAAPSAGLTEKSQETNVAPTIPAQPVKKPETTLATLGPYEPNVPVGVEFVKMGYYCRVCFLFYSNEDTAKKVHCSSQAHYDKLKKHLEKEKAKTQRNGGKN
ncbi:matrin-3-like [Electrophorus electricus]|uniref:matrin-3-like n=1 Tax=Electrophorus electricus TaxID=8005 RepID=UPI0015D0CACF|nr:matrin-3-like [Electrophorus electricus]